MYITTEEDFQQFKNWCNEWISILQLNEYDIWYEHEDNKKNTNYRASITVSFGEHKQATIRLCKHWDTEATSELLDKSALHECLHLLFVELESILFYRDLSEKVKQEFFNRMIHGIINKLIGSYTTIREWN